MHFLLALQDVRLLVDHVLEEVRHDQGRALVLVPRLGELVLQLVVLVLQSLVLGLLLHQVLLVLFELIFEEVYQLFR